MYRLCINVQWSSLEEALTVYNEQFSGLCANSVMKLNIGECNFHHAVSQEL